MPGKVLYDCVAWEQNTANAAMHSAVAGRPLAAQFIAYCSQGEWKEKNENVGGHKAPPWFDYIAPFFTQALYQ